MTKIIETDCGNTTILAGDEIDNVVFITPNAKKKIHEVCSTEPNGTFLRFAVMGGGCSGFQYAFGLDTQLEEDDFSFGEGLSKVVVDNMSMEFVKGSTLDFVSDFGGEYFKVENPHAKSECGCGSSFAPGMY